MSLYQPPNAIIIIEAILSKAIVFGFSMPPFERK